MARSLIPSSRNFPISRMREDMDPFLVIRRQMNRLFDDMFGDFALPGFGRGRPVSSPDHS